MCLLAYIPAGVMPDYEALWVATLTNPDGFGFAGIEGKRIRRARFLDPEPALQAFEEWRANNGGPALFHARYATHGPVTVGNVHPYRINDRTVVAHNGILHHPASHGRSDTRSWVEDVIPTMNLQRALDKAGRRAKLERWLGGSKLVFLTTDKRLEQNAYILNESLGVWDSGVWYSNTGYRYVPPRRTTVTAFDASLSDRVECETCGTFTDSDSARFYGYCTACGSCLDCGGNMHECLCWLPSALTGRP